MTAAESPPPTPIPEDNTLPTEATQQQSLPPAESSGPFKPNIYPVMYWALAYGVTAGILLFLLMLLSRYITIIWFPVFIVGLIWGGFRNYRRQKEDYGRQSGISPAAQSPLDEFKNAAYDIAAASRDLFNSESSDNAVTTEESNINTQYEEGTDDSSDSLSETQPGIQETSDQSPTVDPRLGGPPTTPPTV